MCSSSDVPFVLLIQRKFSSYFRCIHVKFISKVPVLPDAFAQFCQTLARHNIPPFMVHGQVHESVAHLTVHDVWPIPLQVGTLPAILEIAVDMLASTLKNDSRTSGISGHAALGRGRVPRCRVELRSRVCSSFRSVRVSIS